MGAGGGMNFAASILRTSLIILFQAGDGDPEQRSIQHGCLEKIPVCPDAPQRQSSAAYFEVPPTQVVEVGLEVEI
jgi:hypothetical protein